LACRHVDSIKSRIVEATTTETSTEILHHDDFKENVFSRCEFVSSVATSVGLAINKLDQPVSVDLLRDICGQEDSSTDEI